MQIKSPKDFWAGLMFIAFGVFFAVWALVYYQMGSAVRMGPAYFPTVLGGLLVVLGTMVLIGSFAMASGGTKLDLPYSKYDFAIAMAILAVLILATYLLSLPRDYAILAATVILS